jgi:hypothetical protein
MKRNRFCPVAYLSTTNQFGGRKTHLYYSLFSSESMEQNSEEFRTFLMLMELGEYGLKI